MKKLIALTLPFALAAGPTLAASGPFFTLRNTNYVVIISFLLFVGVLLYLKVPGMLAGLLDKRADGIKAELNEAKALREEAQTLLASYERKQKEVKTQADRIVASAKEEAAKAAEQAKADIATSVARRLAAAEDQIANAEKLAIRDIRDQAISVAIGAARDVITKQMSAADAGKLIDAAITEVDAKLH